MTAKEKDLEARTKVFALRVIRFVGVLPKNKANDVLSYQLLKSGTSIGANYREARRAESTDDFIHKIGLVEKETNETKYWIELFDEADIGDPGDRKSLLDEATQLLAIFTRSGRTAKANRARNRLEKR